MNEDERRSIAFGHALLGRVSTHAIPFRWGTAYLDLEFPIRYDSNFLWVEGAPADATVDGLVEEADRILGGHGLGHRRVMVDDAALARQFGSELIARGWSQESTVLMRLDGEPDRDRDPGRAEVLPFAEVRPLLAELTRREPWASSEEVVRQLADYRGKLERLAGARFVVARVAGELAAVCELYVAGDEAQIESVMTLEEHRGVGAASAIVLRAAEIGRAEGASWIHLYADAEDWPQAWYRRLGFADVGRFRSFTLAPASTDPA
ncbi:MAG TPA: GNAT family N-acetyltransferase [Actinomycetota bacterium]